MSPGAKKYEGMPPGRCGPCVIRSGRHRLTLTLWQRVFAVSFPTGGAPGNYRPSAERGELNAATPDPELLEQVLHETLSEGAVANLDAAALQALGEVARRFRGAELAVDPIAIELVKSLLKSHFIGFRLSEAAWQEASRQIATTLYEAPDTQAKLERLWSQLSELVP